MIFLYGSKASHSEMSYKTHYWDWYWQKKYKMNVLSNQQYLKEMSLTVMYGMHAWKAELDSGL